MTYALALILGFLGQVERVRDGTSDATVRGRTRWACPRLNRLEKEQGQAQRDLGESVYHAKLAIQQSQMLDGITGFGFQVNTNLSLFRESALKAAIELRLRELGLPLENIDALRVSYLAKCDEAEKAMREELRDDPQFALGLLDSDPELTDLLVRMSVAEGNQLVVNVLSSVIKSEDERTTHAYAFHVAVDLKSWGTVAASPDYWKTLVSVWNLNGIVILPESDVERKLEESVLEKVDVFANQFLEANRKSPKRKRNRTICP